VLDGYSRFIVHWEIRESSQEMDIELVPQRALEKCHGVHPGSSATTDLSSLPTTSRRSYACRV
jgi:hypothetical protein